MDIIDHDGTRALQKRAPRANAWTEAVKTAFLDQLAATCNVKASARAVGRDYTGAYAIKRRDPVFAAAWAGALEEGYQRLEAELLASALGSAAEPLAFDGDRADAPPIDRELAMKLVGRRHADPHRAPVGMVCKRVPIEEVERELLRHLKVIEARQRRRA